MRVRPSSPLPSPHHTLHNIFANKDSIDSFQLNRRRSLNAYSMGRHLYTLKIAMYGKVINRSSVFFLSKYPWPLLFRRATILWLKKRQYSVEKVYLELDNRAAGFTQTGHWSIDCSRPGLQRNRIEYVTGPLQTLNRRAKKSQDNVREFLLWPSLTSPLARSILARVLESDITQERIAGGA